jgi:hypothetical protein
MATKVHEKLGFFESWGIVPDTITYNLILKDI